LLVVLNWLRVIAAVAVVELLLLNGDENDGELNAAEDDDGEDDNPVFIVGIIMDWLLLLFQDGRALAPLFIIIIMELLLNAAEEYMVALPLGYIMLLLLLLPMIFPMFPIFIALLLLLLLGYMLPTPITPPAPPPPRPAIKPDDVDDNDDMGWVRVPCVLAERE